MGGRGASSGSTEKVKKGNVFSNPRYSFKVTGFVKGANDKNVGVHATVVSTNIKNGKGSRKYKPGSELMISYNSPAFKEAKRTK